MIIILLYFFGVVVILSGYCVCFEIIFKSVIVVFVNVIFIMYLCMYFGLWIVEKIFWIDFNVLFFNGFYEGFFGVIILWVLVIL